MLRLSTSVVEVDTENVTMSSQACANKQEDFVVLAAVLQKSQTFYINDKLSVEEECSLHLVR